MPEEMMKVAELSLNAVGAEDVFARYVTEIREVLEAQDLGERDDGPITFDLKLKIERIDDGLRYEVGGKLKVPGFRGASRSGHRHGNKLKVITHQATTLPLFGDGDGDSKLRPVD